MKKIWQWLNGNKSIIGSLLLAATGLTPVKNIISPDMMPFIQGGISLLTGAALIDHYKKGYFSTKVGNPGQTPKP